MPTTLPANGLVPLDQTGSPLMGLETQSMVHQAGVAAVVFGRDHAQAAWA